MKHPNNMIGPEKYVIKVNLIYFPEIVTDCGPKRSQKGLKTHVSVYFRTSANDCLRFCIFLTIVINKMVRVFTFESANF